ncbi:hypothetical protein C9422_10075 [Pseudomonas sp. B1(2018)]|uniref:HEPN domain-containing protein n=1 Tax=Pseudomonas sp. B1(2018) TaxID=2233856 RepID=UPI000D5D7FDE|nr:HEPN domain-containing protein [Pseudomonas sp. B1(2018)]PVZ59281.1 hypothetical protein C9422_10075 [Pseudomonas sp. B1(2018)]
MYRQELIEISNELFRCERPFRHGKVSINVPDHLIKKMQDLPPIKEIIKNSVNLGTASRSVGVSVVAELLVIGALNNGIEKTVDSLIDYVSQDYTPCVQVLMLRGIKVVRSVELFDGVFIAKPEDVPSLPLIRHLNDYKLRLHTGNFGVMSPFNDYQSDDPPDSVIYKVINAKPKFFPFDADLNKFEVEAKKYFIVGTISNLLPLIFPENSIRHSYYSGALRNSFLESLDLCSWSSSGWADLGVGSREATDEDLESFRNILSKYLALSDDRRSKLDVPLHRLREAARHHNPVDRAIDLGVALEALLLRDQPDQTQLALQFRLRGSWLLGKDLDERKKIYKLLRDVYTYRSTAAHTGKLTSKIKEHEYACGRLTEGLKLCADAIKAVINAGNINWEDLLLGMDNGDEA